MQDILYVSQIKDITISAKLLKFETSKGELSVDVKQLLKEPVNSENAYFDATIIAKHFGKLPNEFLRLPETKRYIDALDISYYGIIPQLKKGWYKTERGRYGGTIFHKKLFLKFASWLDVTFEVEMHRLVENLIINVNELKIEREVTKFLYKPLTDAVKNIYIPKQTSEKAKQFAYSTIANLINIKILGMSASKYRKDNDIPKESAVRDTLSKELLNQIEALEKDVWGYIKYAEITDYQILKDRISKL